jgi:ATP-dependent RNA helicase DeaD
MNAAQLLAPPSFADLGLSTPITQALNDVGYEVPTPIQQQAIPLLLSKRDVIGQAQTGTGKTAAFALPILQNIDFQQGAIQALVLTPTRELAIQVAEAVHSYSKHLGQVRVVPIYGGDSIQKQIGRLRGGVHVVVGTPGRIIDHLRRGTMDLSALKMVVLDEADEMLRMGFIDDVEWILGQAPESRQTALFSATMPNEVRRIADRYLRDPANVEIKRTTLTVPTIEQHYVNTPERQKLEVLTRMLETEIAPGETTIIFTRTKLGAADLADKLQARGYAAEPMHGDMNQAQRETVIRRLRANEVDIVVATDVAARGLDVENVGHVVNYDMPTDPESYVHRIGRTGRAGRSGRAVLFVTPRETRLMRDIERYTGQRLTPARVPSQADVAARRTELFKQSILQTLEGDDLDTYLSLVEDLAEESGRDMAEIAAAAARLARGDKPLVVAVEPPPQEMARSEPGMVRLFINAGRDAGVRPADIVGAIANEAGVPGKAIGAIDIYDDFTFVDVPSQYGAQVVDCLSGAMVRSRQAEVRLATVQDVAPTGSRARPGGTRKSAGARTKGKKRA